MQSSFPMKHLVAVNDSDEEEEDKQDDLASAFREQQVRENPHQFEFEAADLDPYNADGSNTQRDGLRTDRDVY